MSLLNQVRYLVGNGKQEQEREIFEKAKASCMVNGEPIFIGDLLLQAYQKFPDRVAL